MTPNTTPSNSRDTALGLQQPLGSVAISPKFISPLGAQSLNVLQLFPNTHLIGSEGIGSEGTGSYSIQRKADATQQQSDHQRQPATASSETHPSAVSVQPKLDSATASNPTPESATAVTKKSVNTKSINTKSADKASASTADTVWPRSLSHANTADIQPQAAQPQIDSGTINPESPNLASASTTQNVQRLSDGSNYDGSNDSAAVASSHRSIESRTADSITAPSVQKATANESNSSQSNSSQSNSSPSLTPPAKTSLAKTSPANTLSAKSNASAIQASSSETAGSSTLDKVSSTRNIQPSLDSPHSAQDNLAQQHPATSHPATNQPATVNNANTVQRQSADHVSPNLPLSDSNTPASIQRQASEKRPSIQPQTQKNSLPVADSSGSHHPTETTTSSAVNSSTIQKKSSDKSDPQQPLSESSNSNTSNSIQRQVLETPPSVQPQTQKNPSSTISGFGNPPSTTAANSSSADSSSVDSSSIQRKPSDDLNSHPSPSIQAKSESLAGNNTSSNNTSSNISDALETTTVQSASSQNASRQSVPSYSKPDSIQRSPSVSSDDSSSIARQVSSTPSVQSQSKQNAPSKSDSSGSHLSERGTNSSPINSSSTQSAIQRKPLDGLNSQPSPLIQAKSQAQPQASAGTDISPTGSSASEPEIVQRALSHSHSDSIQNSIQKSPSSPEPTKNELENSHTDTANTTNTVQPKSASHTPSESARSEKTLVSAAHNSITPNIQQASQHAGVTNAESIHSSNIHSSNISSSTISNDSNTIAQRVSSKTPSVQAQTPNNAQNNAQAIASSSDSQPSTGTTDSPLVQKNPADELTQPKPLSIQSKSISSAASTGSSGTDIEPPPKNIQRSPSHTNDALTAANSHISPTGSDKTAEIQEKSPSAQHLIQQQSAHSGQHTDTSSAHLNSNRLDSNHSDSNRLSASTSIQKEAIQKEAINPINQRSSSIQPKLGLSPSNDQHSSDTDSAATNGTVQKSPEPSNRIESTSAPISASLSAPASANSLPTHNNNSPPIQRQIGGIELPLQQKSDHHHHHTSNTDATDQPSIDQPSILGQPKLDVSSTGKGSLETTDSLAASGPSLASPIQRQATPTTPSTQRQTVKEPTVQKQTEVNTSSETANPIDHGAQASFSSAFSPPVQAKVTADNNHHVLNAQPKNDEHFTEKSVSASSSPTPSNSTPSSSTLSSSTSSTGIQQSLAPSSTSSTGIQRSPGPTDHSAASSAVSPLNSSPSNSNHSETGHQTNTIQRQSGPTSSSVQTQTGDNLQSKADDPTHHSTQAALPSVGTPSVQAKVTEGSIQQRAENNIQRVETDNPDQSPADLRSPSVQQKHDHFASASGERQHTPSIQTKRHSSAQNENHSETVSSSSPAHIQLSSSASDVKPVSASSGDSGDSGDSASIQTKPTNATSQSLDLVQTKLSSSPTSEVTSEFTKASSAASIQRSQAQPDNSTLTSPNSNSSSSHSSNSSETGHQKNVIQSQVTPAVSTVQKQTEINTFPTDNLSTDNSPTHQSAPEVLSQSTASPSVQAKVAQDDTPQRLIAQPKLDSPSTKESLSETANSSSSVSIQRSLSHQDQSAQRTAATASSDASTHHIQAKANVTEDNNHHVLNAQPKHDEHFTEKSVSASSSSTSSSATPSNSTSSTGIQQSPTTSSTASNGIQQSLAPSSTSSTDIQRSPVPTDHSAVSSAASSAVSPLNSSPSNSNHSETGHQKNVIQRQSGPTTPSVQTPTGENLQPKTDDPTHHSTQAALPSVDTPSVQAKVTEGSIQKPENNIQRVETDHPDQSPAYLSSPSVQQNHDHFASASGERQSTSSIQPKSVQPKLYSSVQNENLSDTDSASSSVDIQRSHSQTDKSESLDNRQVAVQKTQTDKTQLLAQPVQAQTNSSANHSTQGISTTGSSNASTNNVSTSNVSSHDSQAQLIQSQNTTTDLSLQQKLGKTPQQASASAVIPPAASISASSVVQTQPQDNPPVQPQSFTQANSIQAQPHSSPDSEDPSHTVTLSDAIQRSPNQASEPISIENRQTSAPTNLQRSPIYSDDVSNPNTLSSPIQPKSSADTNPPQQQIQQASANAPLSPSVQPAAVADSPQPATPRISETPDIQQSPNPSLPSANHTQLQPSTIPAQWTTVAQLLGEDSGEDSGAHSVSTLSSDQASSAQTPFTQMSSAQMPAAQRSSAQPLSEQTPISQNTPVQQQTDTQAVQEEEDMGADSSSLSADEWQENLRNRLQGALPDGDPESQALIESFLAKASGFENDYNEHFTDTIIERSENDDDFKAAAQEIQIEAAIDVTEEQFFAFLEASLSTEDDTFQSDLAEALKEADPVILETLALRLEDEDDTFLEELADVIFEADVEFPTNYTDEDAVKNLEMLARTMYPIMRQRFEREREREGSRQYSGRLAW